MPYLTGDRIMLREYRMTDLPHIREWVNDPEITDNLSDIFLYPQTVENTEQFVNSMIQGSPNHKGFVIADKVTQDYIGQIDLVDIDWKNRTASLGIVIGKKPYLGQGYGSEAIRLLQELAFHSLNLHRLELMVYEFNERALLLSKVRIPRRRQASPEAVSQGQVLGCDLDGHLAGGI